MTTLNVGSGQAYSTIAAAVTAAQNGDVIDVQAGTYTNDFINVYKSIAFNAVGGMVTLSATVQPPNGKGIVDAGGPGVSVTFNGFAFTGASVDDANGAGIRYEGGNLTVTNSHFFNNQNGILANADPNGTISISSSEFNNNGAGDGYSHNIYIGDIAKFTLTNSYIHDASVGHEIKSRAQTTVITNNRVFDNNSTASYEVDLPNGGNATVADNVIEQGPNSQNPNIIAYGEEGNLHTNSTLSVTGNTIINDENRGTALWNATGANATFQNNAVYGFGSAALVNGSASQSGTTVLNTRPALDTSAPYSVPGAVATPPPPTSTSAGLVLSVSEDAWQGDAQYTIAIDGVQAGSIRTATASHAAGDTQQIDLGSLTAGQHAVDVTFLNDAWGGSPATDRNLHVDGATYNGTALSGATTRIATNSTVSFPVSGEQPATGLVVNVSEDAWQGDAQFTVAVDGQQVGGTYTATASHAAGQSQAISVATTLGAGSHTLGITFLNDAWGGTASTDRNLYVTGAAYNGQPIAGSTFEQATNGITNLDFTTGSGRDSTVTLMVSEDAYQGDAQFIVAIDGKPMGGIFTATASHAAGETQAITIGSISEAFTPHDIAITFINDAWDGTPATDRNLYISSVQFDGTTVPSSAASLMVNSTQHITAVAPSGWTNP